MRRASFTVPWKFDGTDQARVTIEEDRGRGVTPMVIRPYRRRREVRVELGAHAQAVMEKQVKIEIAKKRALKRKAR